MIDWRGRVSREAYSFFRAKDVAVKHCSSNSPICVVPAGELALSLFVSCACPCVYAYFSFDVCHFVDFAPAISQCHIPNFCRLDASEY